jgi:hypothetical protein
MKKPIPPTDLNDRIAVSHFLAESHTYQEHNLSVAKKYLCLSLILTVVSAIILSIMIFHNILK